MNIQVIGPVSFLTAILLFSAFQGADNIIAEQAQGLAGIMNDDKSMTRGANAAAAIRVTVTGGSEPALDPQETSFKTLDKAVSYAAQLYGEYPGSDIAILPGPGHYFIEKTINLDFATGEGSVRLEGAGSGKVIIDGGHSITHWRKTVRLPPGAPAEAFGNIWEARTKVGWHFSQLQLDGRSLPRAASSRSDEWRTWPTGQLAGNERELIVSQADLPENDPASCAELNFLPTPYTYWANAIVPVEHVDTAKGLIRFAPTLFHRPDVLKQIPFRLENTASGLNEPGRWFVDSAQGILYLWPPENADPNRALVTAPFLTTLLSATGTGAKPVRNISISGICMTGAGSGREAGATPISRFSACSSAMMLEHAQDVKVTNCVFRGLDANALSARHCRNLLVERCEIHHCGGAGITLGGTLRAPEPTSRDNIIRHNTIHHCGARYWHSSAISAGISEATLIQRNHVHDMPYAGIMTGGVRHRWFENWPRKRDDLAQVWVEYGDGGRPTIEGVWKLIPGHNIIEWNHVHDVMIKLDDGGAIYCHAGKENTVRHNLVARTHSASSHGLYFDDEECGSLMENNIVTECPIRPTARVGSSLHVHNNARNTIRNNIFHNSSRLFTFPNSYGGHTIERNIFVFSDSAGYLSTPAPVTGKGDGRRQADWTAGPSVMDKNLYWSADGGKAAEKFLAEWRKKTDFDANSIVGDPGFADPTALDFWHGSKQ